MIRRGLTLLEILLSVTILAMMAAACLPIITRSTRLLAAGEPDVPVEALARFADDFVAKPAAFGVEGLESIDLILPLREAEPPVEIAVRSMTADGADHGWVLFTTGEVTVARWFYIEGLEFPDPTGVRGVPGAEEGTR